MLPESKTLSDIDPGYFQTQKTRIMFTIDGVEYEQFIEEMQAACSQGFLTKL